MPRIAREKSKTGIYHVIVRGINRQDIFNDDEDYERYLKTLEKTKKISQCNILGYCLMNNHVHLLIQEKVESISKIMKRIGTSYACWYNEKYNRTGHVFQDRYMSECVEDDKYLLTVIRYIHQNPVKAAIVSQGKEYKWSSYNVYCSSKENLNSIVQVDLILELFSEHKDIAIKRLCKFMEEENSDECLEYKTNKRLNDEELHKEIMRILNGSSISILQQMDKKNRDTILRKVKSIKGISLRQISRVTGISTNIIYRA